MGGGGGLGKAVDAAVDIGIDALIVVARGIENGEGLLGGGCIVEIDEGLPIDFLIQDGELSSKLVGVQCTHRWSVMPWGLSRKSGWREEGAKGGFESDWGVVSSVGLFACEHCPEFSFHSD